MVDGPTVLRKLQSFKLVKDSKWTKSKMLIFCLVLIFALILTTFGISFICWIDDKKSHLKLVLCAWKVQISEFLIFMFLKVMQQHTISCGG